MFTLLFLTPVYWISVQIPTGLPHPDRNEAIDLGNTADLIIYVLIPVAITILYFVGLRKRGRLKWPGF